MIITNELLLKITGGQLLNNFRYSYIKYIVTNSQEVKNNEYLYIAIAKNKEKRLKYIENAYNNNAGCIIAEDESKYTNILVNDSIVTLADIARYYFNYYVETHNIKVFGITGSSGKTTTKDILSQVLELQILSKKIKKDNIVYPISSYNNNIGLPLTIFKLNSRTKYLILEYGTNKQGDLSYLIDIALPHIATITNIGDAHIGTLGNTKGDILLEKRKLSDAVANNKGTIILNIDDKLLNALAIEYLNNNVDVFVYGTYYYINKYKKICFDESKYLLFNQFQSVKQTSCDVTYSGIRRKIIIPYLGEFNAYNIVAALSNLLVIKMHFLRATELLNNIKHVSKSRFALLSNNPIIIDDTYNSNPTACLESLQSFATIYMHYKKCAIIGYMIDMGKDSYNVHYQLGQSIANGIIANIKLSNKPWGERLNSSGYKETRYVTGSNISVSAEYVNSSYNYSYFRPLDIDTIIIVEDRAYGIYKGIVDTLKDINHSVKIFFISNIFDVIHILIMNFNVKNAYFFKASRCVKLERLVQIFYDYSITQH